MPNNPVIPWDAYRSMQAGQQRQDDDPVMATVNAMRASEARQAIMQAGSPDDTAKVTRIARTVGEPPALVDGRTQDYEKAIQADRMASVMSSFPIIGSVFSAAPRTMVAAQDDHKAMGLLGGAWDTIKKVPAELKVSAATLVGMVNDTFYTLADIGNTLTYPIDAALATAINSPIGQAVGLPTYDPDAARAKQQAFVGKLRDQNAQWRESMRPQYSGPIQEGLLRGIDTSTLTLAALLTRNPTAAASAIGAAQAGTSYQDARAAGKDFGTTVRYAATQGMVETATELAPESALLGSLAKHAGPAKVIASYLAEELPGEMTATFLQSLSEWQVMHPDQTYGDWVKSLPADEAQTVLGVIGGGAFVAGAAKAGHAGAALLDKAQAVRTARQNSDALTHFEKAAADSKLRARDPDAYNEVVQHVAADAGVEHVLIPADAVREYMQSDGYDRFSDAFEPYRDQVEEAYSTGGDVVLPASFALGALPGTPAWSALKDDMRLTSGGMSAREAQTFDDAMADVVAELETEMQADHADLQQQVDAQGKLLQSVQAKLQDAGFTPYSAAQQATLLVQRITTRAARLGRDVTGNEFTTEVRQVLPPELAKARKADATDLVINALRKGRSSTINEGPSLIEWISKNGGIWDGDPNSDFKGGDFKAMGLADWHKGKRGRKKAIRDPKLGAGNRGADVVLVDAIEAGYFPELNGYDTAADASILQDAINAELAGSPRYAESAKIDNFRLAAEELDQLLTERGIDPEGLSDDELRAVVAQLDEAGSAEIRAAVGQMEQEGSGDTVNIDPRVTASQDMSVRDRGKLRFTLNEEGMAAATGEFADDSEQPMVGQIGRSATLREQFASGYVRALYGEEMPASYNTEAGRALKAGYQAGKEKLRSYASDGMVYDQLPDSIDIDGVARPTRNSEGMPLAGSEEGLRAFWKWFGDSKVVDEEGRPLVVYHGTGDQFEVFDVAKIGSNATALGYGFYFAVNKDVARGYESDGGTILPVYLAIEKPVGSDAKRLTGPKLKALVRAAVEAEIAAYPDEIPDYKDGFLSNVVDTYSTSYKNAVDEFARILAENDTAVDQLAELANVMGSKKQAFDAATRSGIDGIFVEDFQDGDGPVWIATSPTQIKSINNRGSFDPSDARILYQSAYHGSPHIFDRFSLDAIGTGEGAQAYGWGLYFAGRKEIAEHYREVLSSEYRGDATFNGETFKEIKAKLDADKNAEGDDPRFDALLSLDLIEQAGSVDKAIENADQSELKSVREVAEWMREHYDQLAINKDKGRLYHVEIPNDDEYLLWDKPLSEQPEKVRAAIERLKGGDKPVESLTDDELVAALGGLEQTFGDKEKTGQGFYRELGALKGSDQAASLALHNAGIAGIKYLDGGSRSAGDGSFNYVVIDDSRVSIKAYEQSYADGPRGRIRFEQTPVIELFQGRNMSTLLHELSHQWLEELRADAENPDAPEQVKADWLKVTEWFAANGNPIVDGVIPVKAHEMWARGGERYLMEGKAPSPALASVFETFRGWMMAIYKKVDALRSPITPEIREVFDRLLATDDEIAAARDRQMLEPAFKDAAAVGMAGPEFDAYRAQFIEAKAKASGELLAKTMAAVKRRVMADYRDNRSRLEAEIADEVDARPLFRALSNLKSSPISDEWLRENMGNDVFDLLPKRVPPLWSKRGVHPDAIAELSGYGSGRQMIDALIGAERQQRDAVEQGDKRGMRDRVIQTETDTEMNRRHGDPLTDGTIEREALAAVNNEKQGELLASEVRILARKTGQRPTPYRIAREWARGKVRRGTVSQEAMPAAIQRHARSVSKAGREAEKAILAGKFDEALRFKQQQMLSSALLAEAKAAHDEVQAAQQRMDKIARRKTSKSVDQDYLDQAHALLEQVDLRPRTQKSIERQGKWAEWAAQREAEGFDVVVPQSFEATLGKDHWTRLPVETMLALDETVQQIMHLGRLKQTLLDGKERREFDALVKEAQDGAGNIKQKPPRDLMEPGWWDAVKSGAALADAILLKMETVFDWLDGGNSNGVFNRIAFRPIADAQAREQDMLKDYYGRIKALFEAVPGNVSKRWQDQVVLPFTNRETGLPERMKRHQLIAAALNTGNAGNLQRLTDGHGWNAPALLDYLGQELSADEWAFVQGVWDTIDTLWPEIETLEKRVNGVAPERVEATEIVTPHGTVRGGYYPVIYDSSRSYQQEEHRAASDNSLFEANAIRATTRSGSTKARAEKVNAPVLLDLGVINRHLGEVIHDITHREAVMQAWKFLTNERVMRAVDGALGVAIRQQFKPWVKFVANSWAMERAGNEGFGKWIGKLRANATAVGMGLRVTTMLTQIAGYSNSIEVVGEAAFSQALARTTASPVETTRFVLQNSGEVRHRMDTLDRDLRTEINRMAATAPVKGIHALTDAKRFFYHGIGYMDRMVVIPTWIAAYNSAIAAGMDHDDAVYAGDKAVRVSQGAGSPKDLAAIQRGTGSWGKALQLMTMFYSYFSAEYQRQRTLARDATGQDIRRPRNLPRLAARAWWLLVVPPLLTELLKGVATGNGGPDDDEWWAEWVMRKLLSNAIGPIPLARDVFEPAWNAARGAGWTGTSISPLQRTLESTVNTARDAGKIARGEETKHATKDMLETAGYFTGLVPGQVASATQFLVDVGNGDADPQSFADWREGLMTGKIKD